MSEDRKTAEELNRLTAIIIDAGMSVHSALGPGLLESAYHACLLHELRKRGVFVESNIAVPIIYDGLHIDIGYRVDLLVDREVVVELKAVERVHAVHQAQLMSHIKLLESRIGLLLNFNVARFKDGITRIVNGL